MISPESIVRVSPPSSSPAASAPACIVPACDSEQWFKQEVHVHDSKLKSWLKGSFPSVRHEVEDIAQESYLRLWKRQAVRPIQSAKAFLFQVARHLAVDKIRRHRVVTMQSLQEIDVSVLLDDNSETIRQLSYDEKVDLLAEALACLPDRCREVVVLRKLRELPQKEVASRLGITVCAVESHVTRGMKRLERELRARGVDGFCCDELA